MSLKAVDCFHISQPLLARNEAVSERISITFNDCDGAFVEILIAQVPGGKMQFTAHPQTRFTVSITSFILAHC